MNELLMGLGTCGEGDEPIDGHLEEGRPVAEVWNQSSPWALAASEAVSSGSRSYSVNVVEGVAFVEVVDGAVGADVLFHLMVKGLAGAGDERGVAGKVGAESGELDAMAVPVVDVLAGVVIFPVEVAGGHVAKEGDDKLVGCRRRKGWSG